ncbi:MAG: hypothetical protein GC202_00385 [Alphaproteobacteria bacterium]|nr:hypothetical protein [Alphaproteobacteria bacterium]
MKRLIAAGMFALFLPSCASLTLSSTVTKDAHKVSALDVHFFPRSTLRVETRKISYNFFINSRIDEAQLFKKAGEATTEFARKLVETFPAAARNVDVVRRLSVSESAASSGPAMSDALHKLTFTQDDALVLYPSLAEAYCYEGRCSIFLTLRSLLYDSATKRTMWYGDHKIMIGERFVGSEAENAKFDATSAVEAYWNAVFGTLKSERLIEKDAVVKLQKG